MSEKEYPVDEDYNKYAERLLDFIDTRDRVLAAMKDMTPAQRREVKVPLKVLNESIEELETHLAEQYEVHQKERRVEDEQTRLIDKGFRTAQELYIVIKHCKPEKLEEFTKCLDPLSFEDREEFFDGVAILEATKLDEILTGKKS